MATPVPSGARATPTIAPGCNREAVVALLERFLDTFNRGDHAALAGFFPEQASNPRTFMPGEERFFRSFAVGRREDGKFVREFVAYNRGELLPYLARRQEQAEQLDLRRIEVGEFSRTEGVVAAFELLRQASDLPAYLAVGKAAIDCTNGTIYVWSLGPVT